MKEIKGCTHGKKCRRYEHCAAAFGAPLIDMGGGVYLCPNKYVVVVTVGRVHFIRVDSQAGPRFDPNSDKRWESS